MAKVTPPTIPCDLYPIKKIGSYGELGGSTELKAQYLLTTILPKELESISLISDIPGSEKWEVRDLFQREIDTARVENSIMPYFEDPAKIKFFNPITLTLLPVDRMTNLPMKELPQLKGAEYIDSDKTKYIKYEYANFYRLLVHSVVTSYSRFEWNDAQAKLVAIDGQHRLSALKRIHDKGADSKICKDFVNWSIPVVIILLSKTTQSEKTSLISVIRNIFVYINTEARPVTEARKILLNNESITAICVQEILQNYHQNDVSENQSKKDLKALPLAFFDWRGQEKWIERSRRFERCNAPSALKKIEEVHGWLENYILGDDFAEMDKQESVLSLKDMDPPIRLNRDERLSYSDSERIREQFRDTIMKGLCYLLENFLPYSKYIEEYRNVEKEYALGSSGVKKYAFRELLYGSTFEPRSMSMDVRDAYRELHDGLHEVVLKSGLTTLLQEDIGLRGIICAFGELKDFYNDLKQKTVDWLDYSVWFTDALNKTYKAKWFDDDTESKLLVHISRDPRGKRVNYRFEQIKDSLGLLIQVLILRYGIDPKKDVQEKFWAQAKETLHSTLCKGLKVELKPEAMRRYPVNRTLYNKFLKSRSEELADQKLKMLEKAIGK